MQNRTQWLYCGQKQTRMQQTRIFVGNAAIKIRHTCEMSYTWFPAIRFHSSVTVSPFQKYVRITFIRKNSVAYVRK